MSRRGLLTSCGALIAAPLAGRGAVAELPSPIPRADVAPYPGNTVPPLLVSASWLHERISAADDTLVVLDASTLRDYRDGHIQGAVHAWWQDAMDPNGAVYGSVLKPDENAPDPQKLRRNFIEDLGIAPDARVVLYDNANNRFAVRILWTLRFLGYANTSLLDGGLAAWLGIDGPTETRERNARHVANPPVEPQQNYYVWKEKVLDRLSDPGSMLVDIRTAAERADDIDGTIVTGSIPGSFRLPWDSLLDNATGRLVAPDQLAALVEQAGLAPGRTIVVYGRFGLEATLPWLALKLAAFASVLVYDGGWVDWAQDAATPKQAVATG